MKTKGEFATLLDDLLPLTEETSAEPVKPLMAFDYLAVVEELHSGRIKVSADAVEAEYEDIVATNFEAEFVALLDDERDVPTTEVPPSVEPSDIAADLGCLRGDATALTHMRRDFAFRNHPDRVEAHLRERAKLRMQIANALIDDALRRLTAEPPPT